MGRSESLSPPKACCRKLLRFYRNQTPIVFNNGTETRNSTRRDRVLSPVSHARRRDQSTAEIPEDSVLAWSLYLVAGIDEGLAWPSCGHEIPLGIVDVFSLRRDLRLARSIRGVLKSSYHFVLLRGLLQGVADGAESCGGDSVQPWDCPARWVSAPSSCRGLRYWLVGFPHIRSLAQVRGTRFFCSFGGQSVELDSAYSQSVVPDLIFSFCLFWGHYFRL